MASSFTIYAQERAQAIDWLKDAEPRKRVGGTRYYDPPAIGKRPLPESWKRELERYLLKEAQSGSYNKQREQYLAAQHHMATDQGDSGQAGESKKDIHKHH